jgi:hypothetical protein
VLLTVARDHHNAHLVVFASEARVHAYNGGDDVVRDVIDAAVLDVEAGEQGSVECLDDFPVQLLAADRSALLATLQLLDHQRR